LRRALEDGELHQHATLHRVTSEIDKGEIISQLPFELDTGRSYMWNENTAYRAGISMISDHLKERGLLQNVIEETRV
ncbi:MAG: hypothetical protein AAGB04_15155, partial [Pseudomonadota bacterium]